MNVQIFLCRHRGGGIPDALVRLTVMRKGHRAAKSGASLPTETGGGSNGAVQESDGTSGTGASLRRSGAAFAELVRVGGRPPDSRCAHWQHPRPLPGRTTNV